MENLTQKILRAHLVKGEMIKGSPIEIKMDQTLTQDATGTMAYMQLEAMGVDQVKTEKSISYVDHNTLQSGYMNADDHAYLQSVASKHGIYFSKPGNGICHQVHLERFAKPGKTLIGSDSHTPTSSAMGMIAIGAGGLDVAKAMAGIPYRLTMPEVVNIKLEGKLSHGVSAKDIILEVLRQLSVKGGVGKVFEYSGEALKDLTVYQRATITNMGAELGALEEFGVKKWERYDEAMRSVYGDDTPTLPEELMITMTKSEYDKLCEAYDKLQALECYGVDNWEGYEDAMQSLYDEDEY